MGLGKSDGRERGHDDNTCKIENFSKFLILDIDFINRKRGKVFLGLIRVIIRAENGVTITAVVTGDQLSGDHW